MQLKKKIAVVTGGASGLGAAIVARLTAEGAQVAVADLQPAGACFSRITDVADPHAVQAFFRAVAENFGPIDILVNCAGHGGPPTAVTLVEDNFWARMIAVHLSGTFHCTREALRGMQPRKTGRIINVASVAGLRGFSQTSPYSAAKAGILGLTRAIAAEVIADGIHVNAIAPGFIETPILKNIPSEALHQALTQVPQKRLGNPEEVAGLALLLAGPDGSYMVGQTLSPNGGLYM